jgi:soluble lytic murein transglycosylase-like protein
MSEQRRIDLLFAATVRVLGLGRFLRRSAPALPMVLVSIVAVHGTLGGIVPETAPAQTLVVPSRVAPSPVAGAGPQATSVADESARAGVLAETQPMAKVAPVVEVARAAPKLDREQENIARFISQRYRVTVDATSEFVHHAYRAARDAKLDPMLVLAVMSVESSFNPKAQSHAGAQGLMQVLTRVHVEKFLPFGGIPAAFDPVANIRVGSVILKEYLQREGTVEGALKSYVGAALAAHDGGYGMKVLNARERIAAAAAGRPIPTETAAARAPRPEREKESDRNDAPVMLPVSAIIETRTPLQPAEDGSRNSAVLIHESSYLDASASRLAGSDAASKSGGI